MKKTTTAILVVFFVFVFYSCVAATSKIPVYPDSDSRTKVYMKSTGSYSDVDYVMQGLEVYNHSVYDFEMDIVCVWSGRMGNKLAEDKASTVVKSGTKKRVILSGYYVWDSSPTIYVNCKINNVKVVE